ncbi:hypothetical protein EJ110_NYTH27156 [Nymphaea thermarum]|nr:hypothetical protein EJ110_NYTH27156 [Nymphaea thermarum]
MDCCFPAGVFGLQFPVRLQQNYQLKRVKYKNSEKFVRAGGIPPDEIAIKRGEIHPVSMITAAGGNSTRSKVRGQQLLLALSPSHLRTRGISNPRRSAVAGRPSPLSPRSVAFFAERSIEGESYAEQMDYLVQLLVEQSRIPGMKSGGGLKSKAYTAIEKGMVDKFGYEFTKEKIKNKLKYSKPNLTVMKEILNTNGFGYDPINKCIEVDSQVWNEYIQQYPNRKKYRGPKLWRYFDEFAEVFEDSHATGKESITLNSILHDDIDSVPQTPASQSTPMYMEPETSHSFTQMVNEDPMSTNSPSPQSPVPPTPNTENPMATNRTSSRTKKQRANNYEEYYSLLSRIANNVDTMTRTSKGVQFVTCCEILQEMVETSDIDRRTKVRSMDMIAEGSNALIFVNLPPEEQVSWVFRGTFSSPDSVARLVQGDVQFAIRLKRRCQSAVG